MYLENSIEGLQACPLSRAVGAHSTDVHALLVHSVRQAETKVSRSARFLHGYSMKLDGGGCEDGLQLLVKSTTLVTCRLRILGLWLYFKPASKSMVFTRVWIKRINS